MHRRLRRKASAQESGRRWASREYDDQRVTVNPDSDAADAAAERAEDLSPDQSGGWLANLRASWLSVGSRLALRARASLGPVSGPIKGGQISYRHQLDAQTRIRRDVFNLFDASANDITYSYRSRLPGKPAAGVTDRHSHALESRSARLGLLYSF
jgi:hypothetical protein